VSGNAPLMPEVGVLGLPYHHWGTHWMTPHHVLTRLAKYFHVEWLEPAHHWRDTMQRVRAPAPDLGAAPPGFRVHLPEPWLPDIYRPGWLRNALLRARVRRGFAQLRARGCKKLVLYLWHPQFEGALDDTSYSASLYHIDDEYSFVPNPPPVEPQEARVMSRVNEVIVISPGLMERKSGINPHMAMVSEGVDSALYMSATPEPADIAGIPHPRIGYTGALKRQLDWELLKQLAERHPQWSFVYVGPRTLTPELNTLVDAIERLPNVFMLGRKTFIELAAYPQHFAVCTMPYIVNGYTNNIYPLKLHEYLAGGQPVVASRIRSLLDFPREIHLATGVEEWSSALAAALASSRAPDAAAARAHRQRVAQQHDWRVLIHKIAELAAVRLGVESDARLATARAAAAIG
jgi:glycosyltransferase involved in cell wall biosynthesis